MTTETTWVVDVAVASNDDLRRGVTCRAWARIHLSRVEFPDHMDAELAAADWAMQRLRGMATRITTIV